MALKSKRKEKFELNTSINSASNKKTDTNEKSYAIFKIGNEFYSIEVDPIFEILHDFGIVSVSHLPDFFEGLINLRGESIPVVNLRNLLNLHSDKTDFEVCIVTITDGIKTGFLVDSDIEIIKASEVNVFPLPDCFSSHERKFLDGILEYKDKLVGIIKLNDALKILTERRYKDESK
ncbi:MAG: chemotaxis protein CheW [candidate division WOR-3 bacterium]